MPQFVLALGILHGMTDLLLAWYYQTCILKHIVNRNEKFRQQAISHYEI